MSWQPYNGDMYIDFPALEAWCKALVDAHPKWFAMEEIGQSRYEKPILLVIVGEQTSGVHQRPAMWLDGGTHAPEWTGVMAALHTLSRWAERLAQGDESVVRQFRTRTAYVVPCISPDGFQAMCEGSPFIRSSLRPAKTGTHAVGLRPKDLTGDGGVRWMRWKHRAGPWVIDPEVPMWMRHRTLDDDPEEAYFFCTEGLFEHWDGVRWTNASLEFGLDLNRNFPGSWQPFSMFGMDGGAYPLSEPESRAVVDAVHARPNIAVALSNHTYTGCILTQPYRDPSPLSTSDINLFEALATAAVEGTGYKVIKVNPDFVYDPKVDIVGVWSDTLSTTFGIPGYTLELWSPYGFAGIDIEKPAEFFRKPDPNMIRTLVEAFSKDETSVSPWTQFVHPQLGEIEVGGIDYMRTVRNPPTALLPIEVARGATVADRMLAAVPELDVQVRTATDGEDIIVDVIVQNLGFLPTSASARAQQLNLVPPIRLDASFGEGLRRVEGERTQILGHLEGWGSLQVGPARHAIYPSLGETGPRAHGRWIVRGKGDLLIEWTGTRAGNGRVKFEINEGV